MAVTDAVRGISTRIPRPQRSTIVGGLVLVNVEAMFVLTYLAVTGRSYTLDFLLFPFVWINVGVWALVRTEPPPASTRHRLIALVLAGAYFLVLGYMGNMIAPGEVFGGNPALGFEFVMYGIEPPGWTPHLLYNGTYVHVSLLPPYVIGFAALTYLVYAAILDATSLASLGLVGAFSCVSCTLPLLVAVVTSAIGASSGALLTTIAPYAYEAGMVVYVLTVAALYWRPDVETVGRLRQ